MGNEVDQGTNEPGIVGNWYIDLKRVADSMVTVLHGMPATPEVEMLLAIECDLMSSGHNLAAFPMLKGDIY